MTLEEATRELEEAIAAWAARPLDEGRAQRVHRARAQLAAVKREMEREGQLTLDDEAAQ